MQIKELMTTPVETIAPDESVRAAAQRMRASGVGALPVIEADHIIGIITDRDITVRGTAEGVMAETTSVRALMTPRPILCSPEETVADAARLMVKKAIRRLPVVEASGRLVGMLSVDDLATAAADEGVSEILPSNR